MDKPQVTTAEEWELARADLLKAEKEATRALDALAARRRRLPVVRFGGDYTFGTTQRGVDRLLFTNNILDLTVFGRQEDWEDSPAGWPQHPTYG